MNRVADNVQDYLQWERFLKIDTPLGEDAVLLTAVEGVDKVSSPFSFLIDIATRLSDDQVSGLLGQPVTLYLKNSNQDSVREVSGLVSKLRGPSRYLRHFKHWQAEVVPKLAFLGYTTDCRIFQSMTAVQIIEEVFSLHGLTQADYAIRNLMGTYPTLDYCVQYRETALNFVSRLMEHNGLYYWHEHNKGRHKLIIADTMTAASLAMPDPLWMTSHDQFALIKNLSTDYTFRPGTWTLNDYNFEFPTVDLLSSSPTIITEPTMTNYEVYDYPGFYTDSTEGNRLSRIRAELSETKFQAWHGNGTAVSFDAGRKALIVYEDATQTFFLTSVTHQAQDVTHLAQNGTPPSYHNEFSAVLTNYPYRPDRVTPKPFVQGPQTAVVVGPAGEVIYTDEHGRVKVRFFWDRNPAGSTDENRSCWLRVSQAWADSNFGSVHLPRVGQEVIVDFIDGDPDRPIITGRVYNGDKMHPYTLPANKTQSGFKTQSVGGTGFNEFRIEDQGGSELIYIHAEKDHNIDTGHDHNHDIRHDHNHSVGNTYNVSVANDYNINVNHNITTTTPSTNSETATTKTSTAVSSFDNASTKMGSYGFSFTAAGLNIAVYGLYVQMPFATITIAPFKCDIVSAKVEITKWKTASKSVEFEFGTLTVKKTAMKVETVNTKLENLMTRVSTLDEDISLLELKIFM